MQTVPLIPIGKVFLTFLHDTVRLVAFAVNPSLVLHCFTLSYATAI